MKENIITRKIELIPIGDKQEKNRIITKIKDWQYISRKAANFIASHFYLQDQAKEMIYVKEDVRVKLLNYAKDKEGILNTSYLNTVYKILSEKFKGTIPMGSLATLSQNIYKTYKSEKSDVLKGEKSLRSYRNNIPFVLPKSLIKSLNYNDQDQVIIEIMEKVKLKMNFGKDKSGNEIIVRNIINGYYKLKDSSIIWDKNKSKIFLYMVCGIPVKEKKLDENIIIGMNLGMNTPLYAACNNGTSKKIGYKEEFLYKRLQIQKQKKELSKYVKFNKGGKGRKKKLKPLDNIRQKERNFVKTKNYQYSSELIKYAIEQNAGIIYIEDFKGIAQPKRKKKNNENELIDEKKEYLDKFVLRNWSYFELQNMIEYKAKKEGINVIKKKPAYQSQKCSKCGFIKEENRVSFEIFKCSSCGLNIDPDLNHAINMSRLKPDEELDIK
jgi:IS605 OrfB family transposase